MKTTRRSRAAKKRPGPGANRYPVAGNTVEILELLERELAALPGLVANYTDVLAGKILVKGKCDHALRWDDSDPVEFVEGIAGLVREAVEQAQQRVKHLRGRIEEA